ncbi:hypothetical protein CLV98_104211 [Dyadobacter jejuensis]|uniref:Heavy-metal resistance protein n=1 Tax=Dyadobacter jejuensis TaxID=1082580 RepID=A0A316ALF2_9BACT|nr:hypothetical protein [Dyadobacter jejuensis]PWJ58352.1 hypothetical protein CLV98_104211 [Dyadobacter jejuensis]
MKKILIVAILFAFGLTSVQAQNYPQYDRYSSYNDPYHKKNDRRSTEIDRLQFEVKKGIETGVRRRALSPREASHLQNEYRRIAALERKYSNRGRLSNRETRILKDKLLRLMADTQRLSKDYRNSRAGGQYGRSRY